MFANIKRSVIMRDPERINRILNLIDDIWNKSPDLRLFQLLIGALKFCGKLNTNDFTGREFFNFEDDKLEEYLLINFRDMINEKRT